MPTFDRLCPSCGWTKIDSLEPTTPQPVLCDECGEPTERAWLTKPANVIGDEMDWTQTNGLKHPRRFRSKSEHRRWLKESGWTVKERHAEAGGKDWLAKAEALAQRHGGVGTKEPESEPLNVTFTSGDATPDMVEHYRSRSR